MDNINLLAERYLTLEKRYYTQKEELEQCKEHQLNCMHEKNLHIKDLEDYVKSLEKQIAFLTETNNHLVSENTSYAQTVQEIRGSSSWKVTAPLRKLMKFIHRRR